MVARALLARGSTASSALPEACSSALAALQATGPLPPPPPAAELGRRPFTCSSITALFGGQQQSEEYHEHRHHHEQQHQRYPQRQRRSGPASDTPLGRLSACRTVEDMRAWREGLGEAFGPQELAALVRALFMSESRGSRGLRPGTQGFMRELLTLAADGHVQLDGKAAAYLVWGAAKAQMRGSEPELQRVLPAVLEHTESMKSNDMSSLLWAMGLLGIRPSVEQRAQLRNGLLPLLPEDAEGAMRTKELTATAVGVSRLGLPADIVTALVEAFESRITSGATLTMGEATRLVKVLHHLPGLAPSSPLPLAVFDCLLNSADSPATKLYSLADMAFAAGKMGCCFDSADVERLVSCARDKLQQNFGPQVHTLLHGLGLMGLRAFDDGPVTNEFVIECVDNQLDTAQQPQHMARLISAVGTLRAAVPEDRLQRMFDQLSAAGLDTMPEWQARMALIGFQRLRFQPGIEALEPFVQFKKQQRQQEAQEEEAQEQDAQQQQEEASEQQQQQ